MSASLGHSVGVVGTQCWCRQDTVLVSPGCSVGVAGTQCWRRQDVVSASSGCGVGIVGTLGHSVGDVGRRCRCRYRQEAVSVSLGGGDGMCVDKEVDMNDAPDALEGKGGPRRGRSRVAVKLAS